VSPFRSIYLREEGWNGACPYLNEEAQEKVSSEPAVMLCGYEGEIQLRVHLEKAFAFSGVCDKRINFTSEDETIVPKRVVSVNR
jgi:hypothetical protein